MSLQMIFGRAHSGKTEYVLEKSKELIDNKCPIIYVVPEQFTHIAEMGFIKKIGSIQLGIGEVLSFDRIANRINALHPNGKKPLSSVGKSIIVSQILSQSNLSYYKSSANQPGFVDICIQQIAEFKKYRITPQMLKEVSDKTKNKILSMKLSDLSFIYKSFEEIISEKLSDSDDLLNILAENLEKYKPYYNTTFIFDEFSSFNPLERKIISLLAYQCTNVYITFCADLSPEYCSLFQPTLKTAEQVTKECNLIGVTCLKPIELKNTYYKSSDLGILEKTLYKMPPEKYEYDCSNIRIYASENPYTEVERVATQIVSLIREKNIRYKDIGIVCSDISSYSHIFKFVFNRCKIPYFIDEKMAVLDHSIIYFVLNILDIYIKGYKSDTVVNFLKSGFLSADRDSIIEADNFILATYASKNTWLYEERWDKAVFKYSDGDVSLIDKLNNVRKKYILPLSMLHESIKGKKPADFISSQIYDYLISINFDKCISSYISHFKKENNLYMTKQYESVWKILIEALDMIVYVLKDKKVSVEEYRKYMYIAFSQQQIGIIPTSLDEIVIGDLKRSKSRFVDYQFVIGVNDSKFPSDSADNAVISDSDKNLLKSLGIEVSPDSREKAYFERFLVYSALSHPMNGLVLSYPLSDCSFSPLRHSFVITAILGIFNSLNTLGGIKEDREYNFLSEKNALDFLSKSHCDVNSGIYADNAWKDVYKYFIEKKSEDKLSFITSLVNHERRKIKVSSENINKFIGNDFYTTVSRIQRYNSCRYSYYLEYMLSLKEKKTYGFDNADIGNVVHSVIERVFSSARDDNISSFDFSKEYIIGKVNTILSEILSEYFDADSECSNREMFIFKRLSDTLVYSIEAIRDHIYCSEFEPMGYEITFDENNIGCIELELENKKTVRITGKIDRADTFSDESGTYIRVIDYKTGNKAFSLNDAFYGLDIQLLVYLDALVEKTNNGIYAGALFYKINNPLIDFKLHPETEEIEKEIKKENKMTGIIADDEKVINAYNIFASDLKNRATFKQFAFLGDYIKSGIRKSCIDLINGNIDINPYNSSSASPCSYCSYVGICGFKSGINGKYREIPTLKNDIIWDKIVNGGEK